MGEGGGGERVVRKRKTVQKIVLTGKGGLEADVM